MQNEDHDATALNANNPMCPTRIRETADFLLNQTRHRPLIGIVCGSGLAGVGSVIEEAEIIPYSKIPHFPESTAPGHKSQIVFGKLKGIPVLLLQGRFHIYEGYSLHTCAMPIRVMKLLGVKVVVLSNAAGGLSDHLNVGDIMIVKDHLNLQGFTGINPLRGQNHSFFGPRFFSMTNAYDAELRKVARNVAIKLGAEDVVKEGVYTMMGGPNYETPTELRMLKLNFVDAVGMSTVHEALTARHAGMKVMSFSLITNICCTQLMEEYPDSCTDLENEVTSVAEYRAPLLKNFVTELVSGIQQTLLNDSLQ